MRCMRPSGPPSCDITRVILEPSEKLILSGNLFIFSFNGNFLMVRKIAQDISRDLAYVGFHNAEKTFLVFLCVYESFLFFPVRR